MRYKKELKVAVKSSFGACLGTFIGMGILPYYIFNDIYSDVKRIFISGIGGREQIVNTICSATDFKRRLIYIEN